MDGDETPSFAVPPQPPLDLLPGQNLLPEMLDERATLNAETSARLTGILGQTSVSTPGFSENATRAAEPPLRPNSSSVNQPGAGDGSVAPGALSPPRPPATPAQAPAPPSATTGPLSTLYCTYRVYGPLLRVRLPAVVINNTR